MPAAWHLAVLMFAATFLSAPAAEAIVHALSLTARDVPAFSQLITFSLGAAAILAVPSLRQRTLTLLGAPIPRSCHAEVALAIVVAAMGQFAFFGLHAAVRWIAAGDTAVAAVSLSAARGPDGAFTASTLRGLAIACLMAPLVEEIFYRGVLFEAFARRYRLSVAILLSSAVFASVHEAPLHAFFAGLLLCALYVRTGSLRASILVHFCANAFNWYPLLGQFVIPPDNHGLRSWSVQLVCLATAPLLVIGYAALAARSRASQSAVETSTGLA